MSYPAYPPPVYEGESGEVNAVFKAAGDAHRLLFANGGSADYLATGAETNGQFGLYQWNFASGVSGPEPHFHKSISETFFILSGSVRLYNGGQWVDADQGDFLYVPEGGVHAFKNESGEPASMLLLFAPGAPREGYFEGLHRLGEMTEEERREFFATHDTYWV